MKNLYQHLNGTLAVQLDQAGVLLPRGNWYFRTSDGKLTQRDSIIKHDLDWIFVAPIPDNPPCRMFREVFFTGLKMIALRCISCWKIVIKPKSLAELMDVYQTLCRINGELDDGLPSKAGIEQRTYVNRLYGAYVYSSSLEQGRRRYEIVRGRIDPSIDIILKRGCTEYEQTAGPSDLWKPAPNQAERERRLFDRIDPPPVSIEQPQEVRDCVMCNWVRWAHFCGDETLLEFNEGKWLKPAPVTYHK